MLCPHCGKEITDDSKICEQCGKGIPRCPACNRAMTKRSRFCIYDGTRLPEEVVALFPETEPPVQKIPPEEPVQQNPQGKPAPFVLPVPPEKPAQTSGFQQQPGQYGVPSSQQQPGQYGVPASQQQPGQYGVPASQQQPGQYGVPASQQQNGAVPPARRFCINCGSPCAVNQKYCANCMRGAVPGVAKKKKSKLPILIAILAILLVILCAVVGYLFWDAVSDSEDSDRKSSSSSSRSDDDDKSGKDADDDSDEDSDRKETEQEHQQGETTAPMEPATETTAPPSEQPTEPSTEPMTETTAPPTEPTVTYKYSYELVPSDMSWEEAKRACEKKGGYLATVDSAEEFETISQLAEKSGLTYIWLGACLETGNSEWENTTWITGEEMTFTNWFPGEPSKYDVDGTEEFYLCMWDVSVNGKDVGWTFNDQRNDLVGTMPSLSGKVGYICEYKSEVIG